MDLLQSNLKRSDLALEVCEMDIPNGTELKYCERRQLKGLGPVPVRDLLAIWAGWLPQDALRLRLCHMRDMLC